MTHPIPTQALRPIPATCSKCGSDGLITPPTDAWPKGRFHCPTCNTPKLAVPALLAAIQEAREVP